MIASNTANIDRAVSHYMPPRFPFVQTIKQQDVTNFASLWARIYADRTLRPGGETMLSEMFEVFYNKLFERSDKFRDFFGSNYKERCRILSRQMVFFTTLELDDTVDSVFEDLGKLHQTLGISKYVFSVIFLVRNINNRLISWQYSMFVEVLLESLYAILGDEAEITKMKSATRVISFCLYKLLKYTLLPNTVRPLEMSVNFRDNQVEAIIDRLEEESAFELSKRMDKVSDKMSSSRHSCEDF